MVERHIRLDPAEQRGEVTRVPIHAALLSTKDVYTLCGFRTKRLDVLSPTPPIILAPLLLTLTPPPLFAWSSLRCTPNVRASHWNVVVLFRLKLLLYQERRRSSEANSIGWVCPSLCFYVRSCQSYQHVKTISGLKHNSGKVRHHCVVSQVFVSGIYFCWTVFDWKRAVQRSLKWGLVYGWSVDSFFSCSQGRQWEVRL